MKSLQVLDDKMWFPPVDEADDDGLLAMGGDLRPERLVMAYRRGIFPWYSGQVPLWWSPDPRFVLFPEELPVSKSMQQVLRRGQFKIMRNQDFSGVIRSCRSISRPGQQGTWISPKMIDAYIALHRMGIAESFEAWQDGQLAGGCYGVRMGGIFFGESMFSRVSNASKAAFITAVQIMRQEGVVMIDCQVYTEHLETLGARFIDRESFMEILQKHLPEIKGAGQ